MTGFTTPRPHQDRLLLVLPPTGVKTMRRAAYDAGLSEAEAWRATEGLLGIGVIALLHEKKLWVGSPLVVTDAGRERQMGIVSGAGPG